MADHDPPVPIDGLLAELGFRGTAARQAARAAIEAAGLTNARKQNIASSKVPAVTALLAERFVVVCARASCRAAVAHEAREVIDAEQPADCDLCGGQQNRAEVDRAVAALSARGLRRLVVVGGSPSTHEELRALVGARLELRLVSGTDRRTGREARADLAWADLVVVWGGTELDHKVSKLYTDEKSARVVTCSRRGIAALAATMSDAAARR